MNRLTSGQAGTLWGNTNKFDAFGNLYQFNPIAGVTPGQSMQLSPTANNQLSGGRVVYDAAGNMSSDMAGIPYLYDAENRIANFNSTVAYSYDGDGNRVMKSGGTANRTYWYGASGEVLNEFDTSGNNPVRNIYLGGALRARRYSNGNIDYIASDQIGSARVVVNASGTVEDNNDYLPFGGTAPGGATASGDIYKFTGKERDSESGLDYFGYRYFGSSMGRWTSPDPSGLGYADPTNPQSFNLYSYVLNNPLAFTDPDGMECVWDDGSFDSADDKDTGSHAQCSAAGGNYVDPTAFSTLGAGDWSSQANQSIANIAQALNSGSTVENVYANGNAPTVDVNFAYTFDGAILFGTQHLSGQANPALQLATDVLNYGIPNVCALGLTARAGLPGSRLSFGVDANTQKGIRAAGGARIASLGGVQGSVSVKGKSVSATVSAPIPGTPFTAGISTKNGNTITGVNVGRSIKGVNVQAYADISNWADPNCH